MMVGALRTVSAIRSAAPLAQHAERRRARHPASSTVLAPHRAAPQRMRQAAERPWPSVISVSSRLPVRAQRSEEHTSELQSLMRISYAVFCLKKKKKTTPTSHTPTNHQ